MKLEDQVISLAIARKLKELGVEQISFFYWHEHIYSDNSNSWPGHIKPPNEFILSIGKPSGSYVGGIYQGKEKYYSAYTASELAEMLPESIMLNSCHTDSKIETDLIILKYGIYSIRYRRTGIKRGIEFTDKSLANALGKMLIYLLENSLVPGRKEGA